jgi:pyruvate kinase
MKVLSMTINAIVTVPPYADYIKEILDHKIVSGIRLNTVMPTTGSLDDLLNGLSDMANSRGKDLWVDLKYRQLRIKSYGVPPFTEIELTQDIEVETPVRAYFSGGTESATVIRVDGNKLIMSDGPRRVVGPGESVNIPDKSLKINGYFTDCDKRYIESCMRINQHNYMISFIEDISDSKRLFDLDPAANIIEKIESEKGLEYISKEYVPGKTRLMAARGDLFVEVNKPHKIIDAVNKIIKYDSSAIVASRIFESLSRSLEPTCEDIGDVDNLMRMGYKTLMLGDEVCLRRDSVMSALNLMYAMSEKYN